MREPGLQKSSSVPDSADNPKPNAERAQLAQAPPAREFNDRLVLDLIDAVKGIL